MVTKKRVTPAKTVSPDAERDRSAPEVRVLRRFRLVFNAVKTHFQQVEKKAGVGGAQLWALSVIHVHPGIGVNSLAAFMDIHQTTASNLVKALVTADMIGTEKSAPDCRAVQLRILPTGARVLRKARRATENATESGSPPVPPTLDSEVVPHARRRSFSNATKRRILEAVDRCAQPGEVGALLCREGVYSSFLSTWRRQREAADLAALARADFQQAA